MITLTTTFDDDLDTTLEQSRRESAALVLGDDPVALTCAAYRYFKESGIRYTELGTAIPTEADRTQAANLRKYYADRLLICTLKNKTEDGLSEFRRKLYGVVTDTYQLKKSDIGLLYRLPYFYAEDTDIDHVVSTTTVADFEEAKTEYQTGEFKLYKRVLVTRRYADYIHFWLSKTASTCAYSVAVKTDNPLLSLLESLLKQPVRLRYRAFPKRHRGHHYDHVYYQMGGLELA